jgi:glucuronate isomerase
MTFLGDDYLLDTPAARTLYDEIADLPIVDPHTHADPDEIVANEPYDDIWQVEGATDHYVWTAMRARGVDEELITGDASNREKWTALADVFPELAGNPTYEWVHLDLRRRFGIEQQISAETADDIWTETKARLADDEMRPQELLRAMNVETLATTDDPTDTLDAHQRATGEVDGVDVRPTWRVDRAVAVGSSGWTDFVADLETRTGISADDLTGFRRALAATHDFFADHGCVASDLGIERLVTQSVSDETAGRLYERRLAGESLTASEREALQSALLETVVELNAEKGWVTQLHLGAVRDYRESLAERIGPDAGGDVSTGEIDPTEGLRYLLNRFDGECPFVLYCVDPTQYPSLATLARAFPNVSVGPAWWFNDSPFGMDHQLSYVGTVDLLANHAGMVSDSRKLLSFGSRFEMFRRSLANVLGRQVDRGQIPLSVARERVEHIAYDRPKSLYGL